MSASVERDIAIIDTRAPPLPEALPNPITGIAGSIFMPFQLIRPGNILTAISSPSHAPPHLHQLPTHTTTMDPNHRTMFGITSLRGFSSLSPIRDGHMVMWRGKSMRKKKTEKQSEEWEFSPTAQSNRSQIPSREADFGKRGGKKDSGNSVVANNSFEAEATWGDLMASPGT